LKSAAGTVADAAASDIGISIIESAVNEIDKSHVASTLIGSALRGHRGRKTHAFMKKYPEIVNKRLEDVKRMDPRTELTYKPVGKDEKPEKPAYLQFLEKKREKDQAKLKKALLANPIIGQDLVNLQTPIQKRAATSIQTAIRQKIAKNKVEDLEKQKEQQKKAATSIQTAMRQRLAINKVADEYLGQKQAKATLSEAIKLRKARKEFKEAQDTYDPREHQEKIRAKRKEFARIITTQTTSKQAKNDAQKQFKKTNYVFKRKSNAGRPPKNGAQENEF